MLRDKNGAKLILFDLKNGAKYTYFIAKTGQNVIDQPDMVSYLNAQMGADDFSYG